MAQAGCEAQETGRFGLSTSVVNSRIYAIAGAALVGGEWVCAPTEMYDPVTDTWTEKAGMLTDRINPCTGVVNGKIYAFGGGDVADNLVLVVEEYDPASDKWTRKADMPTGRYAPSTSIVNGKIYAIGGGSAGSCYSTVEVYDPATDTWAKKTDMPTARAWLSTSMVNGKIYAIGGSQNWPHPLSVVEEYTPEGWPFELSPISPRGKLLTKWGEVKSD